MNVDEIKALREAAEYILSMATSKLEDTHPLYHVVEPLRKAQAKVSRFVLDQIGVDGEETVTQDWLKEKYGFDGSELILQSGANKTYWSIHVYIDGDCELNFDTDDGYLCRKSDEYQLPKVTTRHQFRQLAAALGIKPREETT